MYYKIFVYLLIIILTYTSLNSLNENKRLRFCYDDYQDINKKLTQQIYLNIFIVAWLSIYTIISIIKIAYILLVKFYTCIPLYH
jgi:hypothetical protein